MTTQTIEFAQKRSVQPRSNVAQHQSQALLVGVPNNWPSDGGLQQENNSRNAFWNQENTHQDVQFNMLQHNSQKSQNLSTKQFGSQHLGSQTLNDKQMGSHMTSPSLWNSQLLGEQITHQSNMQPMGVYQSTPQFITNQGGLSAGVQEHERLKYVTVEHTDSTLSQNGTLRSSGWQSQFDPSNVRIPQQMQLTSVQDQVQLMHPQIHFQQQQQMLQQQNQQQQQQQLYSRSLHSSLEDQIQIGRQVDESSTTFGNSSKSPAAPLGGTFAVGRSVCTVFCFDEQTYNYILQLFKLYC